MCTKRRGDEKLSRESPEEKIFCHRDERGRDKGKKLAFLRLVITCNNFAFRKGVGWRRQQKKVFSRSGAGVQILGGGPTAAGNDNKLSQEFSSMDF